MSTIVLRSVKGSPLTNAEVDSNFSNLNTDKLEAATTATLTNKTINLTSNTLVATSAQIAAAVTDETGTGALVFANSPTLVAPALGTPASGVVTNLTGTASININGTVGATTASTGAFTTLAASGVATFSAGTAANPAITTSGDTNTGIFFPAADTIAFSEGGVEAMRIDSSGNVGIGTSSPSAKLDVTVDSSGTVATALLLRNPFTSVVGTGTKIYFSCVPDNLRGSYIESASEATNNTTYLAFATNLAGQNATERLRITSAGNTIQTGGTNVSWVGVNAETLGGLSVKYSGQATTSSGPSLAFINDDNIFSTRTPYTSGAIKSIHTSASNGERQADLAFYAHSGGASQSGSLQERMRITSAGNVGIGTSSPSFVTGDGVHIRREGTATLRVERTGATASAGEFFAGNDQVVIQSLTATAPLAFRTGGNPATERMRIDSAGNVGIGTSSPTEVLHVSGNANGATVSALVANTNTGANSNAALKLQTANGAYTLSANRTDQLISLSTPSISNALVVTNVAGNVGIGTSSPAVRLDVTPVGSGAFGELLRVKGTNTGFGQSGAMRVIGGNADSTGLRIEQLGSGNSSGPIASIFNELNSSLRFGTNNLERMRITSAGSVLVGVTTARANINGVTPALQLEGGTANSAGLSILRNSSDVNGASIWFAKSRTGSVAAQSGDTIGGVRFTAADGTNFIQSAAVSADVDGTVSANIVPGRLIFSTMSNSGLLTERMRITSAGNVGIGTSAPFSELQVESAVSGTRIIARTTAAGGTARLQLRGLSSDGTSAAIATITAIPEAAAAATSMSFEVRSSAGTETERMRLDSSGNLLVGTTSLAIPLDSSTSEGFVYENGAYLAVGRDSGVAAIFNRKTNDGDLVQFRSRGTAVGSVSVTATATAYNTSSDQRLKENIQDAAPASTLIDSLQVRQYDWKADGSHQRYGFIAQELVTVAPEAVHQPADPEEMMAVDYSKLVPMLVKEIQSLRARLAAANI